MRNNFINTGIVKKGASLLVLAGVGFATPALAQEEADKGWYIGARTGVAALNNPTYSVVDPEEDDPFTGKLKTKSALALGFETGYDFGGVRVGLDLNYHRNKVRDSIADLPDDEDDEYEADRAKMRQLAVMANVTYDIPISGPVKPYIGAGLGAVGTHLKAYSDDGNEDDGSIRFAWQLRAGASMKLVRGVDLTADYTYRQAKGGKFLFGDEEDGETRLGKTKSSVFAVGLRFTL